MRASISALITAGLFAFCAPALAQSGPTASTETYGDWVHRCSNVPVSQTETAWRCEMAQSVLLRETGQTLLELGLGQIDPEGPIGMVFQVPVTVWLRTPIGIAFGEDTEAEPIATASYFRCTPQACLADMELTPELETQLKTEDTLLISVTDGTQRTIRIPLSLNGFDDAFSATFENAPPAPEGE